MLVRPSFSKMQRIDLSPFLETAISSAEGARNLCRQLLSVNAMMIAFSLSLTMNSFK
jgi:hypothetical protein